jgi:hypothetical protein
MQHRTTKRSGRRLRRAYCVCGIRWPCPDRLRRDRQTVDGAPTAKPWLAGPRLDGSWRP